jgi:hypothetical protein
MQHELAPHIVVISGPAGCCKTALCLRVAEEAHARGRLVRGIVSPPRLVDDVKTGIDVLDLHSGERRALAESGVEGNGPARRGGDSMPKHWRGERRFSAAPYPATCWSSMSWARWSYCAARDGPERWTFCAPVAIAGRWSL